MLFATMAQALQFIENVLLFERLPCHLFISCSNNYSCTKENEIISSSQDTRCFNLIELFNEESLALGANLRSFETKVIIHMSRGEQFYMKENLRFGLILGWLAVLKTAQPIISYFRAFFSLSL